MLELAMVGSVRMSDGILAVFNMALQLVLWTDRFDSSLPFSHHILFYNQLQIIVKLLANYVFMNVSEGSQDQVNHPVHRQPHQEDLQQNH